jgi:hypothetical protein
MWNSRTAVAALSVGLARCCAVGSNANPLPTPDYSDELHAAAEGIVDFGGFGPGAVVFIERLCRRRHARLDEETMALMEAHLDLFAPLLAEAQIPGCGLRREIHEWLRPLADAEAKETMCSALRSWLTDRRLVPSYRRPADGAPEDDERKRIRWAAERRRVLAAELLSDWRDTTAVSLIETVRGLITEEAGGWEALDDEEAHWCWLLDQAVLRIHDAEASPTAVQNGGGGLDILRGAGEIVAAVRVAGGDPPRSDMEVSLPMAARALELLSSNDARVLLTKDSPWSRQWPGDALVICFSDGAKLSLRLTKNGHIICSDNLRLKNTAHEFIDQELREFLLDITAAFQEGYSAYPPFSILSQGGEAAESAGGI